MAEQLKIKLSIANRVYPLTIAPSQEEGLRKAAKKIETMISQFEQNYSVRDKQDVLAMCALQFASQVEQKTIDKEYVNEDVQTRLEALDELITFTFKLITFFKIKQRLLPALVIFFDKLNVNSLKRVSLSCKTALSLNRLLISLLALNLYLRSLYKIRNWCRLFLYLNTN